MGGTHPTGFVNSGNLWMFSVRYTQTDRQADRKKDIQTDRQPKISGIYLSSNVLICICLDRYLCIVHPLAMLTASSKNRLMLTCAWILAALLSLPQVRECTDRLIDQTIELLIDRSINHLIDRSIWSINRSVDHLIDHLIKWLDSSYQSIDRLIDHLISQINRSMDQAINTLLDRSIDHSFYLSINRSINNCSSSYGRRPITQWSKVSPNALV